MKTCNIELRTLARTTLAAISCVALVGFGGDRGDRDDRGGHDKPIPLTVPKAKCGPHDGPRPACKARCPAALRAAGFKGFNCNLELVDQKPRRRRQLADDAVSRTCDWVKHRTCWG